MHPPLCKAATVPVLAPLLCIKYTDIIYISLVKGLFSTSVAFPTVIKLAEKNYLTPPVPSGGHPEGMETAGTAKVPAG